MHHTTTIFPPEILSAKNELRKARLVCRAFDAALIPSFKDTIYVLAIYADMERANLLALQFCLHVKTMIFSSEVSSRVWVWVCLNIQLRVSMWPEGTITPIACFRSSDRNSQVGNSFSDHLAAAWPYYQSSKSSFLPK